jgi:endogenous inhibitor of DNA gyrase (YacG/DUF329 family)
MRHPMLPPLAAMKLFPSSQAKCPHCQSVVYIKDLQKITLPTEWHVRPKLACPRCHELVERIPDPRYLIFFYFFTTVYFCTVSLKSCLDLPERLSFWIVGIDKYPLISIAIVISPYLIFAFLCELISRRSGSLLPDKSCENRKYFETKQSKFASKLEWAAPWINRMGVIVLISSLYIAKHYCNR